MSYGDFKYLARRTASDKVLSDKASNIAKNTKYDGYQKLGYLASVFFDKKSASGIGTTLANKSDFENMSNEQLAK